MNVEGRFQMASIHRTPPSFPKRASDGESQPHSSLQPQPKQLRHQAAAPPQPQPQQPRPHPYPPPQPSVPPNRSALLATPMSSSNADAVELALQRLAASGHGAAGGLANDYRAPPSLPPGGLALRDELRAAPPPPGCFHSPVYAPTLTAHRPPPTLPPPPPGVPHGATLDGEGGRRFTRPLLVAARKHRKPPPLPAHIVERRAATARAAAAAAASREAGWEPPEAPVVCGATPDGVPLTTPIHRRPPPLPTGGAVRAALHSRQHTLPGSPHVPKPGACGACGVPSSAAVPGGSGAGSGSGLGNSLAVQCCCHEAAKGARWGGTSCSSSGWLWQQWSCMRFMISLSSWISKGALKLKKISCLSSAISQSMTWARVRVRVRAQVSLRGRLRVRLGLLGLGLVLGRLAKG